MMGMSVEEYKALQSKPKRSRERNKPTEYNGRMYDSKLQAKHAAELDMMKRAGDIEAWIPEPSIPLPGKVRCMPDWLVIEHINPDGSFLGYFADTKALDKKTGRARVSQAAYNKYKQIEDLYGIKIKIWSK